jgi:hypothetical protein
MATFIPRNSLCNFSRGDRGCMGHGAIMYKAIKTCKIRSKIVK